MPTLEITGVPGDVPALAELIVTDNATDPFRHVEWGLEGPLTYNSGTTLGIDSDNLVTTGFSGTTGTRTGAYDPNSTGPSVVTGTVIGSASAICGTGTLAHVGVFRVRARVWTASAAVELRFVWRNASGNLNHNPWAAPALTGYWASVDLGTITLPTALAGTQAWDGRIEAITTDGSTAAVDVDFIRLTPASDGYGLARAPYAFAPGAIVGYDAFVGTTAGAALGTRAAPLGGSWATSGSTTDFVFQDNLLQGSPADGIESIERTTIAVETTGRFAVLGTATFTDVEVDVRNWTSAANLESGLLARWTDASNHVRLRVPNTQTLSSGTKVETFYVEQLVAGVVTVIAQGTWTRTFGNKYRLRLVVFASGRAIGQVLDDAGTLLASTEGSSSALATGGTLATGKVGVWDRATNASSGGTRRYSGFAVAIPPPEPIVTYPSKTLQVRYDDTIRDDSTGTYMSRPPAYRGSRCVIPVGTSRVAVWTHPNDLDVAAWEPAAVSTSVQVAYTMRGLAVPR